MTQGSLFDVDEPAAPAAATAAPAAGAAPRYQRLAPEVTAAIRAVAEQTLVANRPMLATLAMASGEYFRSVSAGKTYKRNPALRVTIIDPATPDAHEARLFIEPGVLSSGGRGNRTVTVDPGVLRLTSSLLVPRQDGEREWNPRITISVRGGVASFNRHYTNTVDVDVARACAVAARFVSDPTAAIAASGTHCSFCGRALTDPESRGRGIGPECFTHKGNFVNYILAALAQATAESN